MRPKRNVRCWLHAINRTEKSFKTKQKSNQQHAVIKVLFCLRVIVLFFTCLKFDLCLVTKANTQPQKQHNLVYFHFQLSKFAFQCVHNLH